MRALAAQILRYFLGACMGLGTDWLAWVIAWRILGLPPLAAQCIGKAVGGVVAFHLYRTRVFTNESAIEDSSVGSIDSKDKSKDEGRLQLWRFLVALAGGWCIGVGLFAAFSLVLHPLLAKVATDGITFVLNWFVMRGWVFKPSPKIT